MEVDKKIETLEGELKLMRGEVKQSLANIRDFLHNLELPPSPVEAALAADDGSRLNLGGGLAMNSAGAAARVVPPVVAAQETASVPGSGGEPSKGSAGTGSQPVISEAVAQERVSAPRQIVIGAPPEVPEPEVPEPEEKETPPAILEVPDQLLPQSEEVERAPERIMVDRVREQVSPPIPQVNMLANLIRWVSMAREKLGWPERSLAVSNYLYSWRFMALAATCPLN